MIHFNMWKLLQGVSTVIVLVLLAIMAFSYSPHTQDTVMSLMQELKQSRKPSLLDGCYHVYLDVGSNIGVQVRKLFQPEEYPGAAALEVFRETFGEDDPKYICAIGFEPNPNHAAPLKEIEEAFSNCGWRAHFFTETAVSNYTGTTQFYTDNAMGYKEWGAGIVSDNTNTEVNSTTTVNVLRLSKFVLDSVATRELPKAVSRPWTRQPTVLMKLDIEGSEVEVVPDLLLTGAFAHIDATMIEWHERLAKLDERKKLSNNLQAGLEAMTIISPLLRHLDLDDESYGFEQKPLPKCGRT